MKTTHASTKTFLRSTAAVALAFAAAAAQAGTDTDSLAVSASIADNCAIDASAGLSFGAYDPVVANASSPLDATGIIAVTCTSGATAAITLGEGSNPTGTSTPATPERQMNDGGTNNLAYDLYQDGAHTTVWGDTAGTSMGHAGTGLATALTVFGRVPAGQNVPQGSYADSVLATITF